MSRVGEIFDAFQPEPVLSKPAFELFDEGTLGRRIARGADDVVAELEKLLDRRGADETRCAGDEDGRAGGKSERGHFVNPASGWRKERDEGEGRGIFIPPSPSGGHTEPYRRAWPCRLPMQLQMGNKALGERRRSSAVEPRGLPPAPGGPLAPVEASCCRFLGQRGERGGGRAVLLGAVRLELWGARRGTTTRASPLAGGDTIGKRDFFQQSRRC